MFQVNHLSVTHTRDLRSMIAVFSLVLQPGDKAALIGEEGDGKSTLLKTLNRMNDLVEGCRIEGQVLLDGEDVYGSVNVNALRRRVGMVFQKPNPFPMSVYATIAYGPRTHGVRKKAKLDEIAKFAGFRIVPMIFDEYGCLVPAPAEEKHPTSRRRF